jgi:membrane protease YdiL (CAAX protease family)
MDVSGHPQQPLNKWIIVAALVALVIRPLLYTLIPLSDQWAEAVADEDAARSNWWLFISWTIFWQWTPLALLAWSLRRSGLSWSSVGLDWSYFKRRARVFVSVLAVAIIVALLAPHWLYGEDIPSVSDSFFLLPVTGPERLYWLLSAASAALCEEVCYRGLPLALLARSTRAAWLMLPVTVVSFVFVHGSYGITQPTRYIVFGILFGGAFILLRRRKLEWLIIIHGIIDGVAILAP